MPVCSKYSTKGLRVTYYPSLSVPFIHGGQKTHYKICNTLTSPPSSQGIKNERGYHAFVHILCQNSLRICVCYFTYSSQNPTKVGISIPAEVDVRIPP